MGQVGQSVHDPHVSDRRRPTVNDSTDLHLSSEWGVSSPIGGGSVARSAAGIRSSHGFIMMSSDSIIDVFNANCTAVLEIGRQLYATDAGLAQRLLLEARDNIDAILEDFNRQATRRSHMERHSADHQDPPAGGGGSIVKFPSNQDSGFHKIIPVRVE